MLLSYTITIAQNKSLGVGTSTPNANAALHVESPTNNQGIIIPRLTTAQRSSFTGALAAGDVGLIVFDTDLRSLAIWNGTTWDLGSKVGEPITVTNTGTGGNAGTFTLTNAGNNDVAINGTTAGTGHAAYLEITNPSNSNAALFVGTNGSGNAITANGTIQANAFVGDGSGLTNVSAGGLTLPYTGTHASTGTAFDISSTGDGNASSFTIDNASSNARAVYATTNGTGPALDIEKGGNGMAVSIKQMNPTNGDAVVMLDNDGLGPAMTMSIKNAGSSAHALSISNSGSGHAIQAFGSISANTFWGDGSNLTNLPSSGWGLNGNNSTTPGTDFIGTTDAQDVVFKANNTEAVRILSSGQVGIGSTPISAKLDVSSATTTIGVHAASSAPSGVQNRGLQADASGSTAQNIGVYGTGFIDGSNGAIGVYGEGIGNGISDAYGLYGVTNNFTATTGKTFGLYASAENGSANWAGYFDKGNVHIKNALSVGLTDGTFGTTGQVLTSQGAGTAPTWSPLLPYTINTPSAGTLLDVTNSSGGMAASFASANGSQSLYVLNTGIGRAGMFNGSPSSEGVLTAQSGGTGPALSLFHLSNGNAIDIQQGGMRYSVATISVGGTITQIAAIYKVTTNATITLPAATDGQVCIVDNNSGGVISITGIATPPGAGKFAWFIYLGGWRPML